MASSPPNTAGEAIRPAATASADNPVVPNQSGGTTKKIKKTETKHLPGRMLVKEYPVTEQTLNSIGTLRISAAFWFAVGSLAFGFALSCWQSLSLASDVDAATKATWVVYRNVGFAAAAISYLAGGFYFFKGKGVIDYVKENTTHDPVD